MFMDAIVFGVVGFFIGWLLKKSLFAAKDGLGMGGAIGAAAVAWCIAVVVLATWLQGKRNYLMEDLIDRAISQQQARDPSWTSPEQQPIRHSSSSPLAGKAAFFLAIGLFFGIRRRKQTAEPKAVSETGEDKSTPPLSSQFPPKSSLYETPDNEPHASIQGDTMTNYYSILHVLPSAEIDVIKAAYKALARKYHPDTLTGDKAYAGKRMQDINDAFAVIGDPDKRKQYDTKRKAADQKDEFTSNAGDENNAQQEADWVLACKLCPKAKNIYDYLNRLSRSLAFAFQSYMLDTKRFEECEIIGRQFEQDFLQTYFGENQHTKNNAITLLLLGETAAAESLSRAVKVTGSTTGGNAMSMILKENPGTLLRFAFFNAIRDENGWCAVPGILKKLSIPIHQSTKWIFFKSVYWEISYKGEIFTVYYKELRQWMLLHLGDTELFHNVWREPLPLDLLSPPQ